MKTIKAKFSVVSVGDNLDHNNNKVGEMVTLRPVYSPDPASENYSFSKATPSGEISMFISNPDAFGAFSSGREFYVNFVPVETIETSA